MRSAEGCRAVQGGAGQGVHMPKPKFSIKTEVLGGGGGVQWQWQWQRLRLTPPPLCFPVDAFLLTVLSGGLLAREVLYYALCGAISAAKGHHRAPRGPANTVAVHVRCAVQRGAGQCRAVQGRACTCQNNRKSPTVGQQWTVSTPGQHFQEEVKTCLRTRQVIWHLAVGIRR